MMIVPHEKRMDWIDCAKGIGIFLVIFNHCLLYTFEAFDASSYIYCVINSFHVALFFFVSGFLFHPDKAKSFWAFFVKLCRTLLIPYFTFSAVFVVYWAAMKYVFKVTGASLWQETYEFLLQQHFRPVWFLAALFFVELAAYFVCKISQLPVILAVSFAVMILAILYLQFVQFKMYWCLDEVLYMLPVFLLGYCFARIHYRKLLALPLLPLYAAVCVAVNALNLYLNKDMETVSVVDSRFGVYPLYLISALAGVMAVLCLSYKIQSLKLMNFTGRNSLISFALHMLLVYLFQEIARRLPLSAALPMHAYALSATVIIMLVMIPVTLLLTKTPLSYLLGKKYVKRTKGEKNVG